MDEKKNRLGIIVGFVVAILMFFVLYNMFKDSYDDIIDQLADTHMGIFVGLVVLGNCYYLIDALVYYVIIKRDGHKLSFLRCIAVAYMSIFFNVTTFGTGIKPAQVLYMNRKGIDPGKGCGIAIMPYIFHKTIIVVYALIMLMFNNKFVLKNFESTFMYIYLGAFLSVLVIIFLILLCTAGWFHAFVCKLIDKTLGRTRFVDTAENIKKQIALLRDATVKVIKNPKAWISLTFVNAIKMTCWYIIPAFAIYAAGGDMGGVSMAQALTVTSLMQLLMGVIPTSGGVGSLEVVFSLLFAAVFGKVIAGSSMILYRLATYYIPFLFSCVMMVFVGRDAKRSKKPETESEEQPGCRIDFSQIK